MLTILTHKHWILTEAFVPMISETGATIRPFKKHSILKQTQECRLHIEQCRSCYSFVVQSLGWEEFLVSQMGDDTATETRSKVTFCLVLYKNLHQTSNNPRNKTSQIIQGPRLHFFHFSFKIILEIRPNVMAWWWNTKCLQRFKSPFCHTVV